MAISKAHFDILQALDDREVLPQDGRILEIGEANYYGDFEVPAEILGDCDPQDGFAVARRIYVAMFAPREIHAIDAGGPTASKLDLNSPVHGFRDFDVVYNHGTAEHVFNIAQVFRTMHDACKVGGLMLHESPFTGWVDHGFYCLQPTLFWDVAEANGYEILFAATEHLASRTWQTIESREWLLELRRRDALADNLMLFIVLRKRSDAAFVVPMQGVYAGSVSKEASQAWRELR